MPKKSVKKEVQVPTAGSAQAPKPKAQNTGWSSNFQNAGMSFARRAWYGSTPQDARKDVSAYDRQSLLQKARYGEKNYPSMVQYVNDMTNVKSFGLSPKGKQQYIQWILTVLNTTC